jgi:hypothetical protein
MCRRRQKKPPVVFTAGTGRCRATAPGGVHCDLRAHSGAVHQQGVPGRTPVTSWNEHQANGLTSKRAVLKAKRSESFRWYWLAWALVALVSFLVPELYVVFTGRVDLTLSDTLRAILGIDPPSKARKAGSVGFAVTMAGLVSLLISHIIAGAP